MEAHSPPRVFMSHASEDKERFVLPLAAILRERGIDAWVDRWEMLPGDSLVTKIFVEGLDSAAAVVLVISGSSISKRWVVEELNAAVVRRIESGVRLIPIVLDGLPMTQVPSAIRHLLVEQVPDVTMVDQVADRIVRTVFGETGKPPVGTGPSYTDHIAARIEGLDRIDSLILARAGSAAVREFGTHVHTAEFVSNEIADLDISEHELLESLGVLDSAGLVKVHRTFGSGLNGMRSFQLTTSGVETYLRAYEASYPRVEAMIIAQLASWPDEQGAELQLSQAVNAPRLIVDHVLQLCELRGLLKLSRTFGGPGTRFFSISPRLRRLAAR